MIKERRQSVKELVVEAAIELFARQGYSETSVATMASAAGVSVSGLQRAFSEKKQIVEVIWEICNEMLLADLARRTEDLVSRTGKLPTARERILLLAESVLDFSDGTDERARNLVRLTFGETGIPMSVYQTVSSASSRSGGEQYLLDLLKAACKPGIDPENAFGAFIGMLYGKVSWDCAGKSGSDFWAYKKSEFMRVLETFLDSISRQDESIQWKTLENSGISRKDLEELRSSIDSILVNDSNGNR